MQDYHFYYFLIVALVIFSTRQLKGELNRRIAQVTGRGGKILVSKSLDCTGSRRSLMIY